MASRRLIALSLAAALVIPLPVAAAAAPTAPASAIEVRRATGDTLRGDLGPAAAPAVALARVAGRLYVDAADFRFTLRQESLIGVHHRGVQVVDGLPVDDTAASVHIVDGRVVTVQARATDATGRATTHPIRATTAERVALTALGASDAFAVDTLRLLVPTAGVLVDTYRVTVTAPAAAGTVDISAATGAVLATSDRRLFADATATLFDPNPIATSGHVDIRQDVDVAGVDVDASTDPRIAEEYTDLAIREFSLPQAAVGNLRGPWVDVIGAGPFVPVADRFDVVKSDPRFEGLMAYHHIDAIQRYFRDTLGLDDINAEPQLTVALPVQGFDNSFYQPANDLVLFGAGGVDDAEDAEVIIHELGHAIQDDQVPGWGRTAQGGAMGEGFGDFLAATYFATFDGTKRSQDTCLMEWDSTSYATPNPDHGGQTCIRRTDTGKTYLDIGNGVHADGEVWSGYMWNVREHLGATEDERSDNVLRLLLTAHFAMTDQDNFVDAIDALLITARSEAFGLDDETRQLYVDTLIGEAQAMHIPLPPGA